jgi:hypothetical protein
MTWILKYPKTWGFFSWLLSLAAGAAALVLADFGAPAWLFVALGAWLLTAGLPTLIATLAVAAAWGDFPFLGTPPLPAALSAAAALGLFLQLGAFLLVSRAWRRHRAKRP